MVKKNKQKNEFFEIQKKHDKIFDALIKKHNKDYDKQRNALHKKHQKEFDKIAKDRAIDINKFWIKEYGYPYPK